jgi:nucleoside-triphosphatase
MSAVMKNLLLTGVPGIGKSTASLRLANMLTGKVLGGFMTQEIRARGERRGFRLQCFDGTEDTLAHVDFRGFPRVGRYGVDVRAFEAFIKKALAPGSAELYLVDEIGKMECLSRRFITMLENLLASEIPIMATVARRGPGFIAVVKQRPDVELWEITTQNRDALPLRACQWLLARLQP